MNLANVTLRGFDLMLKLAPGEIVFNGISVLCIGAATETKRSMKAAGLLPEAAVVIEMRKCDFEKLNLHDRDDALVDGTKLRFLVCYSEPADPIVRLAFRAAR